MSGSLSLSRLMVFYILFVSLGAIFQAILNASAIFWVSSLTQVKPAIVAGKPRVGVANNATCRISSALTPISTNFPFTNFHEILDPLTFDYLCTPNFLFMEITKNKKFNRRNAEIDKGGRKRAIWQTFQTNISQCKKTNPKRGLTPKT